MMKIKDEEAALGLFERASIQHAEATENGDYKSANKNYASIARAVTFLKNHGKMDLLSGFLTHDSVGVRGWAATYLLPIKEDQAVRVLEIIAKGRGIRSLAAETTLSEWRNGNLKF